MSNMFTGIHFGDELLANWASLMIRVMWQGSFTLALFWLLNRLFPKIHPALRCWLWRIAYIKMLSPYFGLFRYEFRSSRHYKNLLQHWQD